MKYNSQLSIANSAAVAMFEKEFHLILSLSASNENQFIIQVAFVSAKIDRKSMRAKDDDDDHHHAPQD